MKAFEFVKKFGWGEFKELHQASLYVEPFKPPSEKIIGIKKSEIKELFDAFELVESLGGMGMAKAIFDIEINEPHYNYDAVKVTRIEKAIHLVEQCR